ncbi:hypothetical protein Xhom_03619 [Xenorhabdus hominickii]|uniref:Uncharacterized protein n=1 Tax=Xenorhabdus hominickii TaxID=351679 RepID=A0A2G0Q329_XENHO|nr:hypothetical protein Xhom_03619 [Xenorhabdus hominickii]
MIIIGAIPASVNLLTTRKLKIFIFGLFGDLFSCRRAATRNLLDIEPMKSGCSQAMTYTVFL